MTLRRQEGITITFCKTKGRILVKACKKCNRINLYFQTMSLKFLHFSDFCALKTKRVKEDGPL